MISRLSQKRYKFRGQEIANVLWSYATLNAQPDPEIVDASSRYIASVCQGKNGVDEYSIATLFGQRQELANLAWSCAVSLISTQLATVCSVTHKYICYSSRL